MADDELWRKRFHLFMTVRLLGVAFVVAGIAIMFTDLLRPGGWPALGAAVGLIGVVDSLVVPKLLKKHWDREDGKA